MIGGLYASARTQDWITAFCEGRPNHQAIFLEEQRSGEAWNNGVATAQGTAIRTSANDVEYFPGWDRHVLKKFDVFPELGQLSVHSGSNRPQEAVERDAVTIGVSELNVSGDCVVPRQVYEKGVRWHARERGEFRTPANAQFSLDVRTLGYLVAWDDQELVIHHGWDPDEIASRVDYYVANSQLKTGGTSWVEVHLRRGGYQHVQNSQGRWRAERIRLQNSGSTNVE